MITSIKQNTNLGIHLHIFNPSSAQIEYCNQQTRVSLTYEYASINGFQQAAKRWTQPVTDPVEQNKLDRILTAMQKGNDKTIIERIQKTYYACARFIRLHEIFDQSLGALAIDVDAVVRKSIPKLTPDCDFYIHQITGKKARFLAGGLYLNPETNSNQFLYEYAQKLKSYINDDYIWWGLDQDLLDLAVQNYEYKQLPSSLIDWDMRADSCIWTAKGTRKELEIFISEQKKYIPNCRP